MTKLVGVHGSFNHISFGVALLKSIIRPSIARGCAVLIPSFIARIASLESWHYKAVMLILNTNVTISKSALWLSRYTDGFLLCYSVKQLPSTRMCKLVLMPVMEVEYSNTSSGWKYLDHLKLVFNDIGLDNFISNEIN